MKITVSKAIMIRNILGLNSRQMAARLGITPETMTRTEKGQIPLTEKMEQRYLDIMNSKEFKMAKGIIENIDKDISEVTRNEFHEMSTEKQIEYINYFSLENTGEEFVKVTTAGDVVDIFTGDLIDDLWDYATDLDHEETDLHNKLFLEKTYTIRRMFGCSKSQPQTERDIYEICQEGEDIETFDGTEEEAIKYFKDNYNDCDCFVETYNRPRPEYTCHYYTLDIEYNDEIETVESSENYTVAETGMTDEEIRDALSYYCNKMNELTDDESNYSFENNGDCWTIIIEFGGRTECHDLTNGKIEEIAGTSGDDCLNIDLDD